MRYLILLLSFFVFLISCQSDKKKTKITSDVAEVTIRIEEEPGLINPFYSPTSKGRTIFQYLYLPLADYHPETLELSPILIEKIPIGKEVELDGETLLAYDIIFKEDAVWPDGAPLVAKDYLFTVAMIKHPLSIIVGWQPYFEALKKIELNPDNAKAFTIYLDPSYMVALEAALTSYVLPSHKHDPNDVIESISQRIFEDDYQTSDSTEIGIIESVNLTQSHKQEAFQLGPYVISDLQTDEYIVLKAKENYWGSNYTDIPALESKIKTLIFRIVPDELTAVNMAKDGKVDLVEVRSSNTFLDLKNDPNVNEKWTFHVPQVLRYYFLSLNNKSPIFSDKKVRQAFAYLIDVDDVMENIDGGLAVRTTGPFHPTKAYYDKSILPIPYNVDRAIALLEESGWSDTDGDGIRDKTINGKKEILDIEYLFTGSDLAKNIGLLFQESAKTAGVKINIIKKAYPLMSKENLSVFDYDIAALAVGVSLADDDPYSRWHSDNAIPGKRNVSGFSNAEADKLIEKIRTTRNDTERDDAYKALQKVFFEEQPVIFLYCPLLKFMISNKLDASTTTKRPGYLANTFSTVN